MAKLVTNDEDLIGDDELHIFKLWHHQLATGKRSGTLCDNGTCSKRI